MRRPFGLLEALFFLSLFLTGGLINDQYHQVFLTYSGNTLIYMMVGFLGFFIFVWLGFRPATPSRDHWRWAVALATFFIISLIFVVRQTQDRHATQTIKGHNDGVVQTMEAARFLWRGINPYQADYRQTTFGNFPSPAGQDVVNVANNYYAYPPAVVVIAWPFTWLHDRVSGWIDVQSLYFGYFLIFSGLLIWIQRTWYQRTLVTLLTIGNPALWLFAVSGFNDTLFAVCLVAAAIFIGRGQWRLAGIGYGLALASKQTAWLTLPLMAAWWWFTWQQDATIRPQLKRFMAWAIGTALVLYLPFLVWSPADLWLDIVRYPSGSIPLAYPISGWTALQYLRVWNVISSPWDIVPTWAFQASVAAPLYLLAIRQLRRQPTIQWWLGLSTIVILGVTLVSRMGAENYFYAIGLLLLGAYALSAHEDQPNDNALVNTSR